LLCCSLAFADIPRNLLLRFRDDSLDDSNGLAALLQGSPQVAEVLDLSVRTLHGDHLRPLQQMVVDLPPDLARLANNIVYAGGDALGEFWRPTSKKSMLLSSDETH
jgi:hypothetical protein